MDAIIGVLQDFQPAAIVVAIVAIGAIVSGMFEPRVGPWLSLIAVAGVTAYVGNRVFAVDPRPAWLLPLAAAGCLAAVGAGYRLYRAIHAASNQDRTVAYVFPAALAIAALWMSIAFIERSATSDAAAAAAALLTP